MSEEEERKLWNTILVVVNMKRWREENIVAGFLFFCFSPERRESFWKEIPGNIYIFRGGDNLMTTVTRYM